MIGADNSESIMQLPEDVQKASPALYARRAIAITAVFFVVQIIVGTVAGAGRLVYVMAVTGTSDAAILKSAIQEIILPAALVGDAVSAWIAFWMIRRVLAGPLRDGGLAPIGWRPAAAVTTAMAALTGCLLSVTFVFVLARIIPPTDGQIHGPLVMAVLRGGWQRILWAVLALVFAPPVEEFVFRGILLEGLSNSFGVKVAAGIVTAAFVIVHVSETRTYWPAWVAIFFLGGTALLFRLKTRSLIPAISVHFAYNLSLVVITYFRS